MELNDIIKELESLENPSNIKGMERFGIKTLKAYGVRMPELRKIAKKCGQDHKLALDLWDYGYHETRLLATMIENPEEITPQQLDSWVHSFYSWDIVDQACLNLLDKVPLARENIFIWCDAEEEFVKRTAFSLIAVIAVHDKKASDDYFNKYYPIIKEASKDNRNIIKKSVNWALRSIGKRNINCNQRALNVAYDILKLDDKSSRWVANGAIRELESEKVQERLIKKLG